MARIPCPECKKQISETAESCPKCGYKLTPEEAKKIKQKTQNMQMGCVIVSGIAIFIAMLSVFSTSRPPTHQPIQSQSTDRSEWVGTWHVESIGGQPTAQVLSEGSQPDAVVSWDWTFYPDGRFESKTHHDADGIVIGTISGTYRVSGNQYRTKTTSAILSIRGENITMSDEERYQHGTWSRTEDTLNLKPLEQPVMIFKRK